MLTEQSRNVEIIRKHTFPGTPLHALMDDESFDELRGAIAGVCAAAVASEGLLSGDSAAVERGGRAMLNAVYRMFPTLDKDLTPPEWGDMTVAVLKASESAHQADNED